MTINGIGSSYNNYFSYQQAVSQVKLQQALAKNPKIQAYQKQMESVSDTYKEQYRSSSMDFLRDYSTTMSDVMQSANSLRANNTSGVMNTLVSGSSDASVASVSNRYTLRQEKDMTLDVAQLASAQQNVSQGVQSNAAAQQDMAFSISGAKGSFDINVSAMRSDGTAKTNSEMLKEAAAAINSTASGVTASVTQKDGKSVLTLESRNTGTNAAFQVSGQMGAAEGLQNVSAQAANAQYSVTADGKTMQYTSQSNDVQLDYGRMQAELKGTGSTEISVRPDTDKIVSAVSDLLNSYNKAVDFLGDNAAHGQGAANQLQNFSRALASDKTLEKLGISTDKEGNLVLDKEKLVKSLKEEPGLTKQLLSGSAGLAQNLYNRGVSAMNTNSASLIHNDIQAINEYAIADPFQSMNLYSRSGAYTMNNYATLGLMMNYLV